MTATDAACSFLPFSNAAVLVLTPQDFHPILAIANRNDEFLAVTRKAGFNEN
jgi:hypothetical protein